MSHLFRDQSTATMQKHIDRQSLLVLPVGTTEEHGPHLPVDTDARIAESYGEHLARALSDDIPLLLMDTVRYGYSMAVMRNWPGTVIVRSRVFMDMIFDICRSTLDMGFSKLAILDAHGHHKEALGLVSRELCDACDKAIAVMSPATMSQEAFNKLRKSPRGGAIHACEWETSLVMYISPDVVDMTKADNSDIMRYQSEFVAGDSFEGSQKVTWSTWYIQKSTNGVYGDPSVASAETGRLIMDAAVSNGARFLREYWSFAQPVDSLSSKECCSG